MSDMNRYGIVEAKNQREIVLLKGHPCIWGKCAFCDYILDNESDEYTMSAFNQTILNQVTGKFGVLEVINSGSVFELPKETLSVIRNIVKEKNISQLYFESYWSYRNRLSEIREFFNIPIRFKCGLETFDNTFRNSVLKKGFIIQNPQEVVQYFESVCLMVGIKGQTKDMIRQDMDYLQAYFPHGTVNVFVQNTTPIEPDPSIADWFRETYQFLEADPRYEILWNNTDLGVGGAADA